MGTTMQRMKYVCLTVALATTWPTPPAKAAEIAASDSGSILISGRIQPGDETRFQLLLLNLGGRGPIEVHLNSGGGLVDAAMKIADVVHKAGLTTRVPYRATCASACALVFAAGVNRIAHAESRIAVHSIGVPGRPEVDQKMLENDLTLATTTKFARRMSDYGAPPSVVGKLVTTPNDRVSFLTVADLEAWNVKIARDIPGEEIPKTGSAAAVPVTPPGVDSVPRLPTLSSLFASPAPAPRATAPLSSLFASPAPRATAPLSRLFASPADTPAVGGAYVVQVSAQETEDEARASYQALQQKYPSVLGGRDANIRRADLGEKGVYYRAQIGPFATSDQANSFCGDLKAAGGQCIVQEN